MDGTRVSLVTMPTYYSAVPSLALASLCAYLKEAGFVAFRHEFNALLDTSSVEPLLNEAYYDAELYTRLIGGRASITEEPLRRQLQLVDEIIGFCARDVLRDRPTVVGFSLVSSNSLLSILLARRIKAVDPAIKIVFGGPECDYSKNARFLIRTGCVDAVVLGEGEETLCELVRRFSTNEKTGDGQDRCPGALIREGDAIVDGGYRKGQIDMDALPFPDYSLYSEDRGLVQLAIAFNRGCVGRCSYCFESRYWKTYRQMSVGRAVETLSFLKSRYGVSSFSLNQCLLNADIKWVGELCDQVVGRELDVLWKGNARLHPKMDRAYLSRMYAAGCRGLLFGVESGSQSILNAMRKGTKASLGRRVLKDAHECGIWVHAYWILGFPGETREDLIRTLDLVLDCFAYIDSQDFHVFQLYRGTALDCAYESSGSSPSDGEYWHWRYREEVKSSYFLENVDLIVSLAIAVNSLNVQIPLDLGLVEDVRRMESKRRSGIYQLLTLQLFRHLLMDESLIDRLGRETITKTGLLEVYRPIVDELGLDYDYRGFGDELLPRLFDSVSRPGLE